MARLQGMKPASGRTSGPGFFGVGLGMCATQSMCDQLGRPKEMVPGGRRQTILCQRSDAPSSSAARITR
jgi:hypothetical protein